MGTVCIRFSSNSDPSIPSTSPANKRPCPSPKQSSFSHWSLSPRVTPQHRDMELRTLDTELHKLDTDLPQDLPDTGPKPDTAMVAREDMKLLQEVVTTSLKKWEIIFRCLSPRLLQLSQ